MPATAKHPELVPFGHAVAKRRTELGLSLQKVADAMDVEKQTVHLWENAQMSPGLAMVLRLAQALDMNISELVSPLDHLTKASSE